MEQVHHFHFVYLWYSYFTCFLLPSILPSFFFPVLSFPSFPPCLLPFSFLSFSFSYLPLLLLLLFLIGHVRKTLAKENHNRQEIRGKNPILWGCHSRTFCLPGSQTRMFMARYIWVKLRLLRTSIDH